MVTKFTFTLLGLALVSFSRVEGAGNAKNTTTEEHVKVKCESTEKNCAKFGKDYKCVGTIKRGYFCEERLPGHYCEADPHCSFWGPVYRCTFETEPKDNGHGQSYCAAFTPDQLKKRELERKAIQAKAKDHCIDANDCLSKGTDYRCIESEDFFYFNPKFCVLRVGERYCKEDKSCTKFGPKTKCITERDHQYSSVLYFGGYCKEH